MKIEIVFFILNLLIGLFVIYFKKSYSKESFIFYIYPFLGYLLGMDLNIVSGLFLVSFYYSHFTWDEEKNENNTKVLLCSFIFLASLIFLVKNLVFTFFSLFVLLHIESFLSFSQKELKKYKTLINYFFCFMTIAFLALKNLVIDWDLIAIFSCLAFVLFNLISYDSDMDQREKRNKTLINFLLLFTFLNFKDYLQIKWTNNLLLLLMFLTGLLFLAKFISEKKQSQIIDYKYFLLVLCITLLTIVGSKQELLSYILIILPLVFRKYNQNNEINIRPTISIIDLLTLLIFLTPMSLLFNNYYFIVIDSLKILISLLILNDFFSTDEKRQIDLALYYQYLEYLKKDKTILSIISFGLMSLFYLYWYFVVTKNSYLIVILEVFLTSFLLIGAMLLEIVLSKRICTFNSKTKRKVDLETIKYKEITFLITIKRMTAELKLSLQFLCHSIYGIGYSFLYFSFSSGQGKKACFNYFDWFFLASAVLIIFFLGSYKI